MPSVVFWRPRLRGARFDDGEIPLQVLPDLAALREMVIDVAKWRYRQENPDRQEAPRGFADKIDLKLAGIGGGSAVPVISITTTEPALLGIGLPYQKFLTMARDDIAALIAAESENGGAPIAGHLPNKFLAYFNRIGRSLRDDESMEFPMSNGSPPARLTKEKRQRLLQRSNIVEFTQEVTLRGTVPEADQMRMTFALQQVHGGKVAGPMPEQHRDTIISAFNGYKDNTRILVHGIGRYDRRNRLSGMESVAQVTLLDPLDVPARLDEFRAMQNGWLDGAGQAPAPAGLDWLSASCDAYFPADAPLPYAYPTPAGGVRLEWSLGTQEISLDIDLESRRARWHRLDLAADSDDEMELNLDDIAGWERLGTEIIRLAEHTG